MSQILEHHEDDDFSAHRTKIVCTMGPSCWDVDKLVQLIDAGMNVCRLNFSHGDHETHGRVVKNLQEALTQRPGKRVALLLDTKGPEIRTGLLEVRHCRGDLLGATLRRWRGMCFSSTSRFSSWLAFAG